MTDKTTITIQKTYLNKKKRFNEVRVGSLYWNPLTLFLVMFGFLGFIMLLQHCQQFSMFWHRNFLVINFFIALFITSTDAVFSLYNYPI